MTSALDAGTAAGIMTLLSALRIQRGLAVVLVTHDQHLLADHTDDLLDLTAPGRPAATTGRREGAILS
ncbi:MULTISPECIES: hypothetical protein [unclassified Streptomyces]|uniref:hypothetical protein n=1 Tax=unclassified Streptomyces TaxID=2593676 RepID=UPI0033B2C446